MWILQVLNLNSGNPPSLSGGPITKPPNTMAYITKTWKTGFGSKDILYGVYVFRTGVLNHCDADGGFMNWLFTTNRMTVFTDNLGKGI